MVGIRTACNDVHSVRTDLPRTPGTSDRALPRRGSLDLIGRVYAKALPDSLGQPFVVDNCGAAGADPSTGTAQELARMIRDETAKWAKVVMDARLPVE